MSMFQEAQAAKNQSLFREVNERVKDVNESFNLLLELSEWLCECVIETCVDRISMTPPEYEAVRAEGNRFAVSPGDGHVVREVERVVEQQDRYWVVEKIGRAGSIAEKFDPRSQESDIATETKAI